MAVFSRWSAVLLAIVGVSVGVGCSGSTNSGGPASGGISSQAGGGGTAAGGAPGVGGALGSGGAGSGEYIAVFCTGLVDRYIACAQLAASERAATVTTCVSNESGYSPTFTDEFNQAFSACMQTLACDTLQSADDICFPAAVTELNAGLLPADVVTECGSGSSEICASLVPTQVTGTDPISRCLQKWAECTTSSGFTEDDCLSLFAFDASSRDATASACLDLECAAVGQCLADHGTVDW
jgi:hypothetical protein